MMEIKKNSNRTVVNTSKLIKKIGENEKKLDECDANILRLRDEIMAKAAALKEQKEGSRSRRLHVSQKLAHESHMDMDRRQRPSDRGMDIRQYGKMDADIWKYDTLRDWFNCYATPVQPENWSPIESGYTIKVDRK